MPTRDASLTTGSTQEQDTQHGQDPRPRDPFSDAEAVFGKAPARPAAEAPKTPLVPGARQSVTLRIDEDVLEHFQADGPGWQDRINAALRSAAGL